jgi:hypothetical protein
MTEEEFKSLTEDLETVGHYTPTVRDMFQFLADLKGYLRVDMDSPGTWRAYAGVKRNRGEEKDLDNLDYFPQGGRFEAAINELLSANTGIEDMTVYPRMAREFGLDLQMTFTSFTAQFVVKLPDEELLKENEKYEALINKL